MDLCLRSAANPILNGINAIPINLATFIMTSLPLFLRFQELTKALKLKTKSSLFQLPQGEVQCG